MNKFIPIIVVVTLAGIGAFLALPKPAFSEPPMQQITNNDSPGKATRENQTVSKISNLNLLKKVDVANGARPEVVATKDRLFVVYLDISTKSIPSFSVRIYDKDMNKEIAYKKLVLTSIKHGRPTDIRVASDGKYLYAFYEQTDGSVANLFGAKYTLNDNFERVAYTSEPITIAPAWTKEKIGDEVPNDPISLVGPNSIFVITRIYQGSTSIGNPTIYRVREFTNDLKTKLSQFDLNLSDLAGAEGNARQAAASYYGGYYYMIVPTTSKSGSYFVDMATPSDLLLVQFDKNWKVVKYKNLSQNHDDIETFILGLKIYKGLFLITYKQGMPFVGLLNIYDQNFNLMLSETVKEGGETRSALEITDNRIYVGFSGGQGPPPPGAKNKFQGNQSLEPPKAEIYILSYPF